jgi:hypothetical protein
MDVFYPAADRAAEAVFDVRDLAERRIVEVLLIKNRYWGVWREQPPGGAPGARFGCAVLFGVEKRQAFIAIRA